MPNRWKIVSRVSAVMLGFVASPVHAFEAAGMRGLQSGPLGEGPAFTTFGAADGEVEFRYLTVEGNEHFGDASTELSGETTKFKAATGYAVNADLNFVIQLLHERTNVTGDRAADPVVRTSLSKSASEVVAGPSLWLGNVMLGAHASILFAGEDSTTTDGVESKVSSATMPRVRLYSGIKSGSFTGMARLRLYNDARAKVESDDSPDADVKRRSPAETSLDARLEIDRQLAVAASFTFVGAEQASEGALRDFFIYGVGGLYTATPWLALAGGLKYTEPHYASVVDASVFDDNLGGVEVSIGAHYSVDDVTGNMGIGYTIPDLVTRPDEDVGDVELERSIWDVGLGLVFRW